MPLCKYCEEYWVREQPEGDGCIGNLCTECREYTIPKETEEDETE